MCSISGFYNFHGHYKDTEEYFTNILNNMNKALHHRGPDQQNVLLYDSCGLAHTRLSIRDIDNGIQPMTKTVENHTYTICYNGELYNTEEIKGFLSNNSISYNTTCDTEVILNAFIYYGPEFVQMLNGIFSFVIYDDFNKTLYAYRDQMGVKPLYYTISSDKSFIFSSEIKGLFMYPAIKPLIDKRGLQEIFGLGPSKSPGNGVFKNIHDVRPGHFIKVDYYGSMDFCYYRLKSAPHTDNYKETVDKVNFLVTDAIKRQIVSDVPVCTFLSGGIDSSIVTAVTANALKEKGEKLRTFSFDFTDNNKFFKANSFQPGEDRPFVELMSKSAMTEHVFLECNMETMADKLYDSVISRDMPTMADVDSSLLYFCGQVAKYNKVVLTGECADEIFGGYPWFYREDLISANTFPWMKDLSPRTNLLDENFAEALHLPDYVENLYNRLISEINTLPWENETESNRRKIGYINLKMFMQTLLDRMDRTSMYSGLEARVPFADHKIVDYVFNVPWEFKYRDKQEKSLLRNAFRGVVPEQILYRKKSPYPKSYNPLYEKILSEMMIKVLDDSSSPILSFIDTAKVRKFLKASKDLGKPWYGQLMAGPQMIAYLLQINYWMKTYKISIII